MPVVCDGGVIQDAVAEGRLEGTDSRKGGTCSSSSTTSREVGLGKGFVQWPNMTACLQAQVSARR